MQKIILLLQFFQSLCLYLRLTDGIVKVWTNLRPAPAPRNDDCSGHRRDQNQSRSNNVLEMISNEIEHTAVGAMPRSTCGVVHKTAKVRVL